MKAGLIGIEKPWYVHYMARETMQYTLKLARNRIAWINPFIDFNYFHIGLIHSAQNSIFGPKLEFHN